jgi:hypothetical protein
VNRWVLLIGLFLAFPAWAGDWRDTLTPPQPGKFPPPRTFKAAYRFGWGDLTAARADFDFSKAPGGQYRLSMTTQTVGLVRSLWRMDSQHTAVCDAASLRPIRLQQTETYKDETETTQVEFFPDRVKRLTRVTPSEEPPEKEKTFKLPDLFDLQTGLLFVRSQRLQAGDSYRFVTYPSTTPYFAEVEVLGREKLKVAAGTYDAIKCRLRLERVTKKRELAPHAKFKRGIAWLSDDRDRLLLKIEAEITMGSVWTELESVEFKPES